MQKCAEERSQGEGFPPLEGAFRVLDGGGELALRSNMPGAGALEISSPLATLKRAAEEITS